MQCNAPPLHRVDQAVDCGLWNFVPLLLNGCARLLDIGGKWNTLSYTLIQNIPNMPVSFEGEHLPTEVGYDAELQSVQDPGVDNKQADELP